ncbi:MAG: hypothetical protein LBQ86_07190 [Holophagales bacterium]|jgi:predicted HicB family RNase H-like nuclease|nr:hypothetical protein [Holophagales bacterium]
MNHTLRYNNYAASVRYSPEDECYIGKVVSTNHTTLFDGKTIDEAYLRFKEMMDDYPNLCAKLGIEPEIPSTVTIELPSDLYSIAAQKANLKGLSVQELLTQAL